MLSNKEKQKLLHTKTNELLNIFKNACKEDNLEMIEYLLNKDKLINKLEYGSKIDEFGNNHFIYQGFREACLRGSIKTIKYLMFENTLHEKINISRDYTRNKNYGFINACGQGHLEIVKLLVNDINFKNANHISIKDCLRYACMYDRLEIVKCLATSNETAFKFNNEQKENNRDDYLEYAIQAKNMKIIKYLLTSSDLLIKSNPYQIAMDAIDKQDIEILNFLIFDCNLDKEILKPFGVKFRMIEYLFTKRDLEHKLQNELNVSNEKKMIIKL